MKKLVFCNYKGTLVHGARPFIYKGLHRAPGSVAEKSVNNYERTLWQMVLFYVPLHQRKESYYAFNSPSER